MIFLLIDLKEKIVGIAKKENVIKKTCFKKLGYNCKHLFGDKKVSLFKKKNVELKRLYPKNLKGGSIC